MKAIEKGKNLIAVVHNEDTYGIIPERPLHLSVKPLSENSSFMDGIATYKELEMELDFGEKTAKMPFVMVVSKAEIPSPAIILIGMHGRRKRDPFSPPDKSFRTRILQRKKRALRCP